MNLLDECIEALGSQAKVKNPEESGTILKNIQQEVDFTKWGRVNWDLYPDASIVEDASQLTELVKALNLYNSNFFIFWDNAILPIIETSFQNMVHVIDDVTAVGFDTWAYNFEHKIIIEFHHDGEIKLGRVL